MHINRVDIFKYVSREKCEGKNVCAEVLQRLSQTVGIWKNNIKGNSVKTIDATADKATNN